MTNGYGGGIGIPPYVRNGIGGMDYGGIGIQPYVPI